LYDSDNNASESSEEEEDSSSDEETGSENNSEDVKRGRTKVADRDSSSESGAAKDSKPASDEAGKSFFLHQITPSRLHESLTSKV
jgi:hypothetical protein